MVKGAMDGGVEYAPTVIFVDFLMDGFASNERLFFLISISL